MEFVNGKDDNPYIMEGLSHTTNQLSNDDPKQLRLHLWWHGGCHVHLRPLLRRQLQHLQLQLQRAALRVVLQGLGGKAAATPWGIELKWHHLSGSIHS